MRTANSQATRPFTGISDFVTRDFSALASHMNACQRSHGRFFGFRCKLESLHAVVSPRIVTTAALFAVCGLGLIALA